ncbi:Altered inheritance of mitochondria protein 9 [Lasiodiplodia theobromae]|uniref:Altered inheritance of mitochondria protein 9 n=1 Tax=Lasiodiplodia theobromae TaxID=45133 RepID=A0A5N5D7J3_9PEZI|nr:Altered inheritance of mitochondria protein 9 [Lasiodiplodia theobromae]
MMALARSLGVPVPKVLRYDCTQDNPIGWPFIAFEEPDGSEINIWTDLNDEERLKLIDEFADIEARLLSFELPGFGAIYFSRDLPLGCPSFPIPDRDDLKGLCVGPYCTRMWSFQGHEPRDGGPSGPNHLHAALINVTEHWDDITRTKDGHAPPCPISYSEEEKKSVLREQERNGVSAEEAFFISKITETNVLEGVVSFENHNRIRDYVHSTSERVKANDGKYYPDVDDSDSTEEAFETPDEFETVLCKRMGISRATFWRSVADITVWRKNNSLNQRDGYFEEKSRVGRSEWLREQEQQGFEKEEDKEKKRHFDSISHLIILFKFKPEVTAEHKATFVRELKKLKNLPCVKDGRLIVGGPSVTDPIERSKGFEFALVSYHHDRAALEEYQASKEHHWVTSTYMFPFKEDLCRFDFEVAPEDEYMCEHLTSAFIGKSQVNGETALESHASS